MRYLKKSISRFIFFGFINSIISNSLLYLLSFFLPISISAFFSSIFHATVAYFFGKLKIFKKYGNPIKFLILVILSWIFQWQLIKLLKESGFANFQSILIVMPLIAIFSYLVQRIFIFK